MRFFNISVLEFVTRFDNLHKDLLSDKERQMLKQFLETGEKDKHFRMLKMRIKRNYPAIAGDYKLITQAISKLDV